ncbi:MAG: 3-oxoacyl-ACP synthase, partial [Lautropia sp.]
MLCFSIRGWRAASTRMADDDAWRAWAADPSIAQDLPPQRPALEFLGAMQRRRLSGVARLMVDAAWPLVQDDEHLPVVYVSHDGEINRSFELWLTLLKEGTVSPTSFGLSVHNALVGQWSMLRRDG